MLNQDFIDILSAFSEEKVEFLVVGGYAMAFHGYVRTTGDIDLWIRCSRENANKARRALLEFGAPLFDWSVEDLMTPGMVFQIGMIPSRIDVITQIDAVDFEEAWQSREVIELQDLVVPVISKAHLLANKRSTGRPKDRIDVLWLENE